MTMTTINSGRLYHIYIANLTTAWGGQDVHLTEQQALEYVHDPDGFAVKHFGLDPRGISRVGREQRQGPVRRGKPVSESPAGNTLTRGCQLERADVESAAQIRVLQNPRRGIIALQFR